MRHRLPAAGGCHQYLGTGFFRLRPRDGNQYPDSPERLPGGPYRGGVDRDRALAELTVAHAVALRLRAAGADDEAIAAALGIDVAGVPALLEVAEAKLRAELARDPGR
jgi:hypothetical protein